MNTKIEELSNLRSEFNHSKAKKDAALEDKNLTAYFSRWMEVLIIGLEIDKLVKSTMVYDEEFMAFEPAVDSTTFSLVTDSMGYARKQGWIK